MLRCPILFTLMAAFTGCASSQPHAPVADQNFELTDTPFFTQSTDQCGPAALTSVLQFSGSSAGFDAVAKRVYLPERGGSLQLELLATARAYDRLPVRIPANPEAIVEQLSHGRPVLVMQNLGLPLLPIWHYAVVMGYRAESDEFVLRSGTNKRHSMTQRSFTRTWARADHWAIVIFQPSDEIAGVEADAYLREAAAMESIGQYPSARSAYSSAMARWPELAMAELGYANSLFGIGDLAGAEKAYRELLATEPDDIASRNNLAQTLADMGCTAEALELIDDTPAHLETHALYRHLSATRNEILSNSTAVPQGADALCRAPP